MANNAALENKMPNVSSLLKKLSIIQKLKKLKRKLLLIRIMINIILLKKLTLENFTARLTQTNLSRKNDIAAVTKKTDFDDKLKNLSKNVT